MCSHFRILDCFEILVLFDIIPLTIYKRKRMKKIVFMALGFTSLVFAQENDVDLQKLQADISKVEQQKKELEEKLKTLKAQLPQDTSLKTHTQFGYIATTGNTRTESFTLNTKWTKEFGKNKIIWTLDAQYGKAEDDGEYTTNKNKFFTELEYDYTLSKRLTSNYLVGYKHDKFSSYTYQFYTGPGVKYKVLKTDAHDVSLEGNVLYSQDKYMESDEKNNYASLQTKGVYSWKILENLKFDQSLSYRVEAQDMENYFIYSDTELSSKVSEMFSAGLGYKIDYVNKPGDKKHTDKTLLATLSIDY